MRVHILHACQTRGAWLSTFNHHCICHVWTPNTPLTFIATAFWDEVEVWSLLTVGTPSTVGTLFAEPAMRVVRGVHGVGGGGASRRGRVREGAAGLGSP